MQKLLEEIKALQIRSTGLRVKIDAVKIMDEMRSLQPEIDEVAQDLEFKRNKLYAMQQTQGPENRATAVPQGQFNPLGTYSYGTCVGQAQGTETRGSEQKMPDKNDVFASAEYRSAFYKTLLGQP